MKNIGALSLGLAFAGCFLGAGYVSGQELWQFFGSFGKNGAFGLVLAVLILFAVGTVMLGLSRASGEAAADKLVIMWDIPLLRAAVNVLEAVFLFGVCMIMSAGIGALFQQIFGIPPFIGSAVFAVITAVISLAGFSGMVKAFSAIVPILAAVTLVFGIASVCRNGVSLPAATVSDANPLIGSWLIAALSFACYNLFGSIAMIAPLGQSIKSSRTGRLGIGIGSLLLLLIAGSVLVCVGAEPETASAELPMLVYASQKGSAVGLVYGALLLLAMFGTSLSSLVGFVNIMCLKFTRVKERKVLFTAVTAAGFFLGSLFGFGKLIGYIYPVFGYAGSVFIVLMIVHYIKIRKS